ncbi:TrbI/VirB10 family protein [Novosphingobium sp. ST904]|uniref:TrbI/VirB10 family protein n=1 Tax=Novosphingobium sp. ST904 TaxID=1684385 RepID=UPI0009E93D61|nr:TrbI/VirB10 family protein [Novosphingobium sp. ST904]TCM22973.1 type IV secretion system protein VirB4 [Novosphingobium sp. ST904]
MLNLAEYRSRFDRLADHLPWAALVAPGVVLNKDGSFQRSFAFRGPDLESSTEAELVGACARANNVLRRLGSGWAIFFEAHRREVSSYPQSEFFDAASWLIDEERRAAFEAEGHHFESVFTGTLLWLPPPDSSDAAGRSLIERPEAEAGERGGRDWRAALAGFIAETDRILDLFGGFMPEVRGMSSEDTLSYLHGTVSDRAVKLTVPETPVYLDAVLADTPFIGGLEPRLGRLHVRTLTLPGFPNVSRPGLLDALNHQGFGYRWMTRFIAMDRADATKVLTKLRRQWFNKRKSITALLREVMYNQPTQLVDSDADNKVIDADTALQALGGDHVSFGYLTATITVADEDRSRVEEKVRAIERVVNGLGFTCIREGVNAVEAWLSSLPGQVYANVRQPLVHSLNLAHLMPLSAVWAGQEGNTHLGGPPLFHARTQGSTPFRFSTHVGDVGHMLVVGPTGAGKSVLLSLIACQFRRYRGSQVIMFDMGLSARAAVLAMGGKHHALGQGADELLGLSFQPLRHIDDPVERSWAADWILDLLTHELLVTSPEMRDHVWSALTNLAGAPENERTLTGLSLLLHALTPAASANMLSAGSVIAGSLITGLRSDLPGLVIAQVTQQVFDSATGRTLLIPQGARLIGSYDSLVAFGQKRALIVWQRIVMPDGSSIRLDNVPATDMSGYAGLEDQVDAHTWQVIKGAAISTLLGVGSDLTLTGESDLVQAIRQSTQQSVSRAGDQLVSRSLQVQPTITIRPGAPVRLVVQRDLVLEPWFKGFGR